MREEDVKVSENRALPFGLLYYRAAGGSWSVGMPTKCR
jgi:hypothetical protein